MLLRILIAIVGIVSFALLAGCNLTGNKKAEQEPPIEAPKPPDRPPFGSPALPGAGAYDVWEHVWCPDAQDSGKNFKPVASLEGLPVHPLGDGINNCYMAAYDTSRFSTDGNPVRGCDNLDPTAFGEGYTCREIRTAEDFARLGSDKVVAIVMNDITGIERFWMGSNKRESLIIMGTYDPQTLRPVLLEGSVKFAWNSQIPVSDFSVINLRIKSKTGCFATTTNRPTQITLTLQSVTAKCAGRFIMQSSESPFEKPQLINTLKQEYFERTGEELADTNGNGKLLDDADRAAAWPVDDRTYFRNVMALGGQSHTAYLDHTFLDWVQDSIIYGPLNKGKHPIKMTAQYNIVHNSIFANAGLHSQPLIETDWADRYPHPKDGGMAEFSLTACNRTVIDRTTIFHLFQQWSPGGGHSNPSAIQWQLRPEIGAGCDVPFAYTTSLQPVPYKKTTYFPNFYDGRLYEASPYWTEEFWENVDPESPWNNPYMLTSFVTGVDLRYVNLDEDIYPDIATIAGITSSGSYPTATVRPGGDASMYLGYIEAPPWWKERMRVVFNNNALDIPNPTRCRVLGPRPSETRNPDLDPEIYERIKDIKRCFFVGPNTKESVGEVDPEIAAARDALVASLPAPPWTAWDER